jgi:hypothetical protein
MSKDEYNMLGFLWKKIYYFKYFYNEKSKFILLVLLIFSSSDIQGKEYGLSLSSLIMEENPSSGTSLLGEVRGERINNRQEHLCPE